MPVKVTANDLDSAEQCLVSLASKCGFEVKGWVVFRGSSWYKLSYRPIGQATLTTIDIGKTRREAHSFLSAMMLVLVETSKLSSENSKLKKTLFVHSSLVSHKATCSVCRSGKTDLCMEFRKIEKCVMNAILADAGKDGPDSKLRVNTQ